MKNAYYLRHCCLSTRINAAPTRRVSVTFDIGNLYEELPTKSKSG